MTQDIQLNYPSGNRMIIKVCCQHTRFFIICRVLERGKIMDIHIPWNNHYTSGVLAASPLDPRTSGDQTIHLRLALSHTTFLQVFLHKAVGRLISNSAYRTGSEHMSLTKQFLGVLMGPGLVITREVQVNIRNLVTFKPQKHLKGDIKAIFFIQGMAIGTFFIGQVSPAAY